MIAMSVNSFTRLRKQFICNVRKMAKNFIRADAKRFEFSRKANKFRVFVYYKSMKRKLFLVSRFKCRSGRSYSMIIKIMYRAVIPSIAPTTASNNRGEFCHQGISVN